MASDKEKIVGIEAVEKLRPESFSKIFTIAFLTIVNIC